MRAARDPYQRIRTIQVVGPLRHTAHIRVRPLILRYSAHDAASIIPAYGVCLQNYAVGSFGKQLKTTKKRWFVRN